jgi:hypothetical protein
MNETDNDPRPDWAALGWITDRLPTRKDADAQGNVWLPREMGDSAEGEDGTYVSYLAVVAPGQPWWSSNAADRANEPAPAEPDRIAALEQRVAELETFRALLLLGSRFRLVAEPQS